MGERDIATALAIRGPFADVVEQARVVDALGYHSVWVPEIAGRDALTVCAALAQETSDVRLATGIVPMPVRAAETLAMGAAGLAEMTGGRFVLGVGSGHAESHSGRMRLRDMETYLTTLRALLHDGTSGSFRLRGVHPPAPPPIVLAALGARTIELAGRLADGVILNWATPAYAARLAASFREAADRAGRDPDALEVACFVPACVTDDLAAARRELARQIAAYGTLRAYAAVLERSGVGRIRQGDIPDHVCDALGAHGSAGDVHARLDDYRLGGVTLPVLVPYPVGEDPWASMTETWSSLAPR